MQPIERNLDITIRRQMLSCVHNDSSATEFMDGTK